jgi:hypothetical protein
MFYERECQEQTTPDLAAESFFLAASLLCMELPSRLRICHASSRIALPVSIRSSRICHGLTGG